MASREQRPTNSSKTRKARLDTEPAKDRFLELVRSGDNINVALEKIGYSRKWYELHRRNDENFKALADQARLLKDVGKTETRGERLDFATFRKKYLHVETHWHQLQWVDVLEGKEPREMHDAQTYTPARRNRIIVNVPPNHGKSITITVDYVVYRLCMDPSFRVLLISAGAELAKDFLFGVKQRLTSPDFIDMQMAYAPEGGWEETAEAWSESRIIFNSGHRQKGSAEFHEKDANVLALGMRSKIYGRRADLAIVDDGVDTTNVAEHAKQLKWLRTMVESRLEQGGKCLVIGTRVAPVDLYSELLNADNYANRVVPWTYFASPAILHEGPTPQDHVTLWPRQSSPWVHPEDLKQGDLCDCGEASCSEGFEWGGERVYARWDGIHLEVGPRASLSATEWALVYQQSGVDENSTFPEHAIIKSTNTQRLRGRLESDRVGHPYKGMHGKYIVAGLDPAIKGFAGIIVMAVDRETNKRYILDVVNMKAPTTAELESRMKELTLLYDINEWRVEKTGLLQFFTQRAELRSWFASRGTRFVEHTTGNNKWDTGYGVSSMAPLFGEYDRAHNDPNGNWRIITEPLIELPRIHTDALKALVHQLLTWTPELDPNKVPCDLVMALWFAVTGSREYLNVGRSSTSLTFARGNKFVSPARQKTQRVSFADYRSNTQ